MVITTASGLLFSYFFLTTTDVDAIMAAVDVAQTTVSGLSAFFSYVEDAATVVTP